MTRIEKIKLNVIILYLSYKDERTPKIAKAISFLVVAFALSPIDLIPDFIPIVGLMDDFILIPIGTFFALKMIPSGVIESSRKEALNLLAKKKPIMKQGIVIVVVLWLVLAAFIAHAFYF